MEALLVLGDKGVRNPEPADVEPEAETRRRFAGRCAAAVAVAKFMAGKESSSRSSWNWEGLRSVGAASARKTTTKVLRARFDEGLTAVVVVCSPKGPKVEQ